jgi:hypothetical protein
MLTNKKDIEIVNSPILEKVNSLDEFLIDTQFNYQHIFIYDDQFFDAFLGLWIIFFLCMINFFILIKETHMLNFAIALELYSLYMFTLCLILLLWNHVQMAGLLLIAILVIGASELCMGLVLYFSFLNHNRILNWNLFKNTRS